MAKKFRRTLLAVAALAMLGTIASADQSGPVVEQLPPMSQQGSKSGADLLAPLPSPGVPADEQMPGEIISDGSPFTNDGWPGVSVSDSGTTSCDSCCTESGCCNTCRDDAAPPKITADVELMALRTHFGEEALGKLGERYEMSERFVLAAENANGIGVRMRYWTYDHTTPNLQGGSSLRADWDVTDFEGTTHFGTKCFDLLLAGGVRWADINMVIDRGRCRNDMPGATFALDLRGLICTDCERNLVWRSVSGARLSIFGGDWELSHGLVGPTRDDNLMVTEIYGGVECAHCCRGHEMYARLVMEAQNWRSDALGEATDVDSIGFIGPGLNIGMNY